MSPLKRTEASGTNELHMIHKHDVHLAGRESLLPGYVLQYHVSAERGQ